MKKVLSVSAALVMALFFGGSAVFAADSISNTGPGSTNVIEHNNQCDVDIDNDTDVDINADTDQDADSGDATSNSNTSGGGASSGDAGNDNSVGADVTVTNGSGNGCNPCDCDGSNYGDPSRPKGADNPSQAQDQPQEPQQVVAPVGGIDAGAGGATSGFSLANLLGLSISVTLFGGSTLRLRRGSIATPRSAK